MVKLRTAVTSLLEVQDPRDVPAYSIPQAAHYLRIPTATLRSWVLGRSYQVQGGAKRFEPLVRLADPSIPYLTFYNLAEAHVLGAFRRRHNVDFRAIRDALDYVSSRYGWERPLIQQDFQTDGIGLLIEQEGVLVDASASGQRIIRECVAERLRRIEWEDRLAARLYPFTRLHLSESPKMVLIDPRRSFGQPFLVKSGIPTAVIAERYKAGDSVEHLARDYACRGEEIEEAIRCELNTAVAA